MMEKPDPFAFGADDQPLSWLANMQPTKADALKPDFLYRAGYEAARTDLIQTMRRRLAIGSAAMLFIAISVGSIAFNVGSRHGQLLATSKVSRVDAALSQSPMLVPSPNLNTEESEGDIDEPGMAYRSEAHSESAARGSSGDHSPAQPRWWQLRLRPLLASTSGQANSAYPTVRLGPVGARWADLVHFGDSGAASHVNKPSALDSPAPRSEPRKPPSALPSIGADLVLPLRDNRIQSLLNELL